MDVLPPTPPPPTVRSGAGAGGEGGLLGPKDSVGDNERGIWEEGNNTLPALCAPGASPGRRGFRRGGGGDTIRCRPYALQGRHQAGGGSGGGTKSRTPTNSPKENQDISKDTGAKEAECAGSSGCLIWGKLQTVLESGAMLLVRQSPPHQTCVCRLWHAIRVTVHPCAAPHPPFGTWIPPHTRQTMGQTAGNFHLLQTTHRMPFCFKDKTVQYTTQCSKGAGWGSGGVVRILP